MITAERLPRLRVRCYMLLAFYCDPPSCVSSLDTHGFGESLRRYAESWWAGGSKTSFFCFLVTYLVDRGTCWVGPSHVEWGRRHASAPRLPTCLVFDSGSIHADRPTDRQTDRPTDHSSDGRGTDGGTRAGRRQSNHDVERPTQSSSPSV
uniref:Uncharacterized protein n=1 Tax=Hyaloperonospora arabidopsidis (strain Emoy2) TaxID=559515 RepID=M4BH00_HYAAE